MNIIHFAIPFSSREITQFTLRNWNHIIKKLIWICSFLDLINSLVNKESKLTEIDVDRRGSDLARLLARSLHLQKAIIHLLLEAQEVFSLD